MVDDQTATHAVVDVRKSNRWASSRSEPGACQAVTVI